LTSHGLPGSLKSELWLLDCSLDSLFGHGRILDLMKKTHQIIFHVSTDLEGHMLILSTVFIQFFHSVSFLSFHCEELILR
jgi:hypothetical protein